MKVKTKEDLDKLDQKIQDDLGVDVKRYANPEVVARFVEMLLFPAYALFWLSIPMLLFFLAFIAGYWIPSFTGWDILGYSTFGLVFSLLTSFSFSLLFLLFQTKKDIRSILAYSLEIMKNILFDTKHLDGRVKPEEQKEVRKLLFHGVIHLVTIPTVTQVIAEKIPVIGELFSGLIKKVLRLFTLKVNLESSIKLSETEGKDWSFVESSIKKVDQAKSTINVVLWSVFGVVSIPLFILFIFSFCSLLLTMWVLL